LLRIKELGFGELTKVVDIVELLFGQCRDLKSCFGIIKLELVSRLNKLRRLIVLNLQREVQLQVVDWIVGSNEPHVAKEHEWAYEEEKHDSQAEASADFLFNGTHLSSKLLLIVRRVTHLRIKHCVVDLS
jgi:hypothetical protein